MSDTRSTHNMPDQFSMDWSDRYLLGVEIIDQQHQKLFRLVDQLARGIQAGNSNSTLQAVFDELTKYTKTHFETEARLMAASEYPDRAEHGAKHHELEASLAELIEKSRRGEPWVSLEAMNFLRQWLYHHIDGTDRNFAAYLRSRDAA